MPEALIHVLRPRETTLVHGKTENNEEKAALSPKSLPMVQCILIVIGNCTFLEQLNLTASL